MSYGFRSEHSVNLLEHSYSDLLYLMLDGPVSFEPMKILDKRAVAWGWWTVEFYVLGASHAMSLSRGTRVFTELLSCAELDTDENISVLVEIEQQPHFTATLEDLIVEFQVATLPLTPVEPFAGNMDDTDWMEQPFIVPSSGATAWTRLRWNITVDCVRLETLHTYPQEKMCVISKTIIRERTEPDSEYNHGG